MATNDKMKNFFGFINFGTFDKPVKFSSKMRLSTRELMCKDKSASSNVKKKVEKTNPHWSSFWQIASSDTSLTEGHSTNRKTKKTGFV